MVNGDFAKPWFGKNLASGKKNKLSSSPSVREHSGRRPQAALSPAISTISAMSESDRMGPPLNLKIRRPMSSPSSNEPPCKRFKVNFKAQSSDDLTQEPKETDLTQEPEEAKDTFTVTVRKGSIVHYCDPKDTSRVLKSVRIKQDMQLTVAKKTKNYTAETETETTKDTTAAET